MPEFKIQRVNYFEGQRLRVDDFKDEQAYHLDMRRRHNKNLHNWGIATGLKVNWEKGTNKITISPGMALDVEGHEIVLDEPWVVENILTLTSAANGAFILTLKYFDEKVNSATNGVCSSGLTRVAEKTALFLHAEIGDFIPDGKEVPLAKITLENCKIKGDPVESVREEVSQGKAVKITGDKMTGPLTIDFSDVKSQGTKKGHLYLIAAKDSASTSDKPRVTSDAEGIMFWTEPNDNDAGHAIDIQARKLVIEKDSAEDKSPAAIPQHGIMLSDGRQTWQIFQFGDSINTPADPLAKALVIGEVVEAGGTKSVRPGLSLTPDNTVTLGANADSQLKILGKVRTKVEIDLQKQTPELALAVKGIIDAQKYLENGQPLPQSAWENVSMGIAYKQENKNVGIGTGTPSTRLHVEGGSDVTHGGGGFLTLGPIAGHNIAIDDNEIMARDNGAKSALHLQADGGDLVIHGNQANTKVVVTDDGRVGIGTDANEPLAKLQVSGGAIMPAVGNSETSGIQFPPDPGGGTGDRAFIRYFAEENERTKLLIGCENDAEDRISFQQASGERLTIYNRNVGIDITSPAEKLHVAGNLRLNDERAEIYAHDRNHMIVLRGLQDRTAQNSTSYYQFGGTLAQERGHRFFTGGAVADQAERLRISNDGIYMAGKLGLGTIAPEANLHLKNTRAELRIENTEAGDYAFLSLRGKLADYWDIALKGDSSNLEFRPNGGDANRIMMTNLGNVGIGTAAAPTEKLEVAGNLKVTQNAFVAGKVLIGKTPAPTAQLHIAATAVVDNDLLLEHAGGSKLRLWNKRISGNEPAASWIGTPEAFALHLCTHDQSRIHIATDGKVGIGKAAEAVQERLLDVNGEVNATGFTINNNPLPSNQLQNVAAGIGLHLPAGKFEIGTVAIGVEPRKNGSLQILGGGNQLPFKIDSTGLRCMEIDYTGAAANPDIVLQAFMRGGAEKWCLQTNNDDLLGLASKSPTGIEQAFWLKQTGEVGIGTKAPAAKLHLKGESTGEGFDFLKIEDSAANALSVFLRKKIGAQTDLLTFETRTSDSGQIIHDELLNFDLLNKKVAVGMTGAITDKLDVHGNLKVTGKLRVTENATLSGNVSVGTSGGATKNNLSVLGDLNVTGGAFTVNGASVLNGDVRVGNVNNSANLTATGRLHLGEAQTVEFNAIVLQDSIVESKFFSLRKASDVVAFKTDKSTKGDLNRQLLSVDLKNGVVTIGAEPGTPEDEGVLLIVDGKIQATEFIGPFSPAGGGEGGPTAAIAAERVMSSAEKSLGIGTDAPKAKLHVRGDKRRFDALLINDGMSGSKDFLLQKEARTATLQSSEGNLMTLDLENLNVGIGTAKAPTEKLEIAGNIKVEGEALIMEDVTIGTTALPADLEVLGQLFGAAKGPAAEAFRIAVGHTPTPAIWRHEPDKENVVYVDVDCSSGGFTATPFYFTSLHGDSDHWATVGVTSIHKPTAKGFRVFVHQKGITAERARELNWQVKWLGVGN